MPEPDLEALAARVSALERQVAKMKVASKEPPKDWRAIVGILEDDEFTRSWIAEMKAIREEDRRAAREGRAEPLE